jgi:hypothetical protein
VQKRIVDEVHLVVFYTIPVKNRLCLVFCDVEQHRVKLFRMPYGMYTHCDAGAPNGQPEHVLGIVGIKFGGMKKAQSNRACPSTKLYGHDDVISVTRIIGLASISVSRIHLSSSPPSRLAS